MNECPKDKIYNPITKRCVLINGKIGKELLKNQSQIEDKILNPKTNRYVSINGKIGKELLKNQKEEKKEENIIIINKSIIYNINENDVILDPAGFDYINQNTTLGAGGASKPIYALLKTTHFNKDVIKHFSQFKKEEDLYDKNKNNKSIACFTKYDNINIIHAIGPDFRSSRYLKNIIEDDNSSKLDKLFFKVYDDIYNQFIIQYKLNENLKLRLLPISSGVFINFNEEYKIKIYKSFLKNYLLLNKKYKITPSIYFYYKPDFDSFNSLI
jgi:hypothetical protein